MANEQGKVTEENKEVIFAYRTGRQQDVMLRKLAKTDIPKVEDFVTFNHGYLQTSDPEVIRLLRDHPSNEKNSKGKLAAAKCFRELSDLDSRMLREKIMKSRLPKRLHIRQLGVLNGEFPSLQDD